MTTALTTIAPKLGKLIPLLASDKPGEVVATAAAITRTLKQAGADWHDLAKVLGRAEPPARVEPVCWRDIPQSEQAEVARRDAHQPTALALGAKFLQLDPGAGAVSAVERALAEASRDTRSLHLQACRGGAEMSATIIRLPTTRRKPKTQGSSAMAPVTAMM